MAEQGGRGRSLIYTEARAHAAAHASGRWVSSRAGGVCSLGVGSGRSRVVAWLDRTVSGWSR
jgi:hypothetical protein